MNWPVAAIAAVFLLAVVGWAVVIPVCREIDERDLADNDHQARAVRHAARDSQRFASGAPPAWLGATLPAAAPRVRLSAPRVSGGRVTRLNRIRYQYALADQPVCQVLAAYGWHAQEVTT